jgi:hypothetical protein
LKLVVDDPMSAADCLDALAWIAAADGRQIRAAHLLGAVECEQQTRAALGESRFEAALRVGAELTFADAVALVLEESTVPVP